MVINWRQGFGRLSRALLGLSWVIFFAVHFMDFNPAKMGEDLVYMVIFTVGYLAFHALVAWIVNGFVSSDAEPAEAPKP